MPDGSPQAPTPVFVPAESQVFPGPFAALFLTLAAIFATAFVVTLLGDQPFMASMGIGWAFGFGGVATLAARRVPEPQVQRIGLQGFDPRLLFSVLALLPVVIVISELDNWMRAALPPMPEIAEQQAEIQELVKIDSVYSAIQTGIVALGITPVVEGFLFFGVMLQGLVAHLGRPRGVLMTAVLYSLVHFPAAGAPGDAIVPLASALITGALFCLVRLATGSILPTILLSSAFSAVYLSAAALSETVPIPGFNASGDHTPFIIVLPCALLVLHAIWTLSHHALLQPIHLAIPESEEPDAEDGFHF